MEYVPDLPYTLTELELFLGLLLPRFARRFSTSLDVLLFPLTPTCSPPQHGLENGVHATITGLLHTSHPSPANVHDVDILGVDAQMACRVSPRRKYPSNTR